MIRWAPSLLPSVRRPGLRAIPIGVATLMGLLALAAVLLVGPVRDRAGRLTIQVSATDPSRREALAITILHRLQADPAVRNAGRVDPGDLARLAGVAPETLPVLIDATLARAAGRTPPAAAIQHMPGVTVATDVQAAPALPAMLHRLAMLVAAGAAACLILFAPRLPAPTLLILRELGAREGQIAQQATESAAMDIAGGAGGAFLAAALLILTAAAGPGITGWVALLLAACFAAALALAASAGWALVALRRLP